jgi:outer membrane receptor protein involved in Fe transport
VNTTDWQQFSVDGGGLLGGGVLELHGVGSSQDYYQTFSAVAASLDTERLTFAQTIDTQHRAVNGQWSRPINRVTMIVGADYRHTDSLQDEFRYVLVSGVNTQTGPFKSGGTETVAAAYARANVAVTDAMTVELGGRVDSWESVPAPPQLPTDPVLPTKDVTYFSPRGAISIRAGKVQMQASVYHANRTPSLNELHRRFAVGNQVTNANPLLDPEKLTGVEGGVLTQVGTTSVRATAFFNNLEDAISTVTLSSTPTATIRQRQNSDSIRATGIEFEAESRLPNNFTVSGQIVFTSSHFRGSVATPAIADNTVPQVPKVQGGFMATWTSPRWFTASTQVRFSGEQFDDDLNTPALVLGEYGVWDALFSRAIMRSISGFFAIENITDMEYDTAKTPLRAIGYPRTIRVGARVTWQ